MYNLDIYHFLNKINKINLDNNSVNIIKDLVLDLSKNKSKNNNLVIEIINIEKINRTFFKMNKNNENSNQIHFCTICQNNIKKGEHKTKLCNCNHIFHKKCLNKCLKIQKINFKCPICRESYKKILHDIAENKCEL